MRVALRLLVVAVALVACGEGDAVVSQTPPGAGGGGQAGGAGAAGAAGTAGAAGGGQAGAAGGSAGGSSGGAGSAGNPLCAEAFDPHPVAHRHQFVRDANGLHVLGFTLGPKTNDPAKTRLTTYAPLTGEKLEDRAIEPTSTATKPSQSTVAVASDGDRHVAVLMFTTTKEVPWRAVVMLGSTDPAEGGWVEWSPPWSYPSTEDVHVGWDGEAFVVVAYSDSSAGAQPGLYMARVSREGVTVQGKTYIGENATLVPLDHEMRTDAKTGRTLYVASSSPGVWLGGFERDGSPLAPGGKLTKIKPTGECKYGGSTPSVAASGGGVVAYTAELGGCIQGLSNASVAWAVPLEAPVLKTKTGPLTDTPGATALEEREEGWFAAIERYTGVYQRSIDATGAPSPESLLIKLNDCATTTCNTASITDGFHLGVMRLTTMRWQDELWLAYEDTTNSSNADAPGLPPTGALRMLRIAPGCTYRSSYLLHNP